MKRNTFFKSTICAAFVAVVFCLGAQTAQAQIQPFVDCIELRYEPGAEFYVYFGYINYSIVPQTIPVTSNSNKLAPYSAPGQPTVFHPGIHPRVFSVRLPDHTTEVSWTTTRNTIKFTRLLGEYQLCNADDANARLTTFQGRLSDGNQPANGTYDLLFRLYDAPTGGTARTLPIALEDVPVSGGVFTVQLDLGTNNLVYPRGEPLVFSQTVNTHLAAGKNGFFEIAVRPGNAPATGDYTLLAPRQPLTAVPLAVRANMANNSVFASLAGNAYRLAGKTADQFVLTTDGRLTDSRPPTGGSADYIQNTTAPQANSNFNIAGSGTVGGTLTANGAVTINNTLTTNGAATVGGDLTTVGTIASGCRSGFTAIANGRLCVSAMQAAATFYGASGAIKTCANLAARVGGSADLMLTIGTSLDYRSNLRGGWLADHIGDNVWAVWTNGFGETDFDGIPLNVVNGGANGTAPSLPFRCVY